MELKDFIKKALLDVTDAVHEARRESKSTIAPAHLHYKDKSVTFDSVEYVEFDLATVVMNKPSKSGRAKASISVVGLNASIAGSASAATEHSETSRIKFKIPVAFNATPFWGNENDKSENNGK